MGAKNSRPSANKPGAGLREDTLTRVHQRDVLSSKQRSVSQRSPAIPRNPLSWSTGSLPDRLEYDANVTTVDPEALRDLLIQMGVQFNEEELVGEPPEVNGDSVIKIFATSQEPDYTLPWQTLDVTDARGSGVVIDGGRILTAAHVVAQYTFIEVQKAKESKKVPAKALHICHDADLALIQPLDSSFLNDITPIKIGKMPKRRDPIFVSGYPIGGEELSTTEGVVSRVELQPYSHSLRELLAVTVDAAINSGNSGGPVFNGDGELAGIAFQALEGAANVGHIIPPPIINHFIGGFDKDGDGYQGFPELGTVVQSLENPALRKHLKLPDTKSGVLVTRLIYGNSGYGVLKEGDVILNIDGNDVNNDGSVQYNSHDRGNYQQIIHSHYVGDVIPITVWRDSTELVLQVTLEPVRELVALSQYIHRPSYYLFNGLLFQPLSTDLLRAYFSGGLMIQAPQELLYLTTVAGAPTKTRRQALVLTRVFRDDVNVGYEDLSFSVIEKVNGADVKDLADLVDKIENAQGELVELTTSQRNTIILPNKSATESTDAFKRIAKRYNVTSDRYIGDKKHHKKHHKKEDK